MSTPTEPEPNPPPIPTPDRDGVTPYLCASTYLHASFADYVLDWLVGETHRATYPSWNIDELVLARHAQEAQRRRIERDKTQRLICVAAFSVLLFLLCLAVTGALGWTRALLLAVLTGAVSWVLAMVTAWTYYARAYTTALDIVFGEPDDPPPLSPDDEARLAALRNSNVVVFTGDPPFAGSGVEMDAWTLTVDLSAGRRESGITIANPRELQAADLHKHLLKALPPLLEPLRPRASHRLYIRGANAITIKELFRSGPPVAGNHPAFVRWRQPDTTVPPHVVERYMNAPEPNAVARTYTCFEIVNRSGQFVVTLLVRATRSEDTLLIEGHVYGLLPMRPVFQDVRLISLDELEQRKALWRTTFPIAWGQMVSAPSRLAKRSKAIKDWKLDMEEQVLQLIHTRDIDYGARTSLRADLAVTKVGEHFPRFDILEMNQFLNRHALDCIVEFLDCHRVDIENVVGQANTIKARNVVMAQHMEGSSFNHLVGNPGGGAMAGPTGG